MYTPDYQTVGKVTQAACSYVIEKGEAHPLAPKTERIQQAILAFDGNEPSEDEIYCAYRAYFEVKAPSKAFAKYVASIPDNYR